MNFTIQLKGDVTLTTMQEQTVLFSKATGDFYGLNPTAATLLEKLLRSDFRTTVQTAAADFGVSEAEIETDLLEVIDSLKESELVVRTECH